MENNQEMQKWMEQMERSNRQQVRYARLQCFFSFAAALCCAALLFAVIRVLPQVQQITGQVQDLAVQAETVLTNLETVTNELAAVDLGSMVTNVDSLVSSSQEGVEQALGKINSLDIDSLNQAIADLSEVVEPLAKFFKAFG